MSVWLRVLTSLGIFRIVLLTSNTYRLQMVSQGDDGAYDFAYDTGEGNYHIQSRNPNGTITGKFAYLSPDGMLREIGYTADDNGFRPEGDLHPPPPALWNLGKKKNAPSDSSSQIPDAKPEEFRTHDRRHLETTKVRTQLPVHPPVRQPSQPPQLPVRQPSQPPQLPVRQPSQPPVHQPPRLPVRQQAHPPILQSSETFPFQNTRQDSDFLSGPLPRMKDVSSTPVSVPLTSNLPFPIAPLLSSGTFPFTNNAGFNGRSDTGTLGSSVIPQPKTASTLLLSALAQLTGDEPQLTSAPPRDIPQVPQQKPDIPNEPVNTPEIPPPPPPPPTAPRSPQSARLRQVRLKLLQLITLLEEMEEEPNHALKSRSLDPKDFTPSPDVDASTPPPPLLPLSKLPPSSSNIPEDLNKFPSSSDVVVRKIPELETPLFTPVEGVRQVGGQRILERSYIPLTRRYGYVYSQQN